MERKTIALCDYEHLRKSSNGYGGISLESISTVMHKHLDFYEIILIFSGEWEHTIDNSTTTVPTGTLILTKPGVTHQLFTNTPNSTHFVICVEQKYFEKTVSRLFPHFELDSFSMYLSCTTSAEKLKYIEQVSHHLLSDSKMRHALSDEILYLTISDFVCQNDILDCTQYVKEIIKKLDRFVYINHSVKEICANYPYSQSVLLRQFKKLTGMTIVEYKARQKLKYACLLLTDTDTKIIEIASTLQYSSLSHFLSTFKKAYGMTPSHYRNKYSLKNNKEIRNE